MKPNQQQLIEFCHSNKIIDYLNIDIVPQNEDNVQLELTVSDEHINFGAICHGGVLATMADNAMGLACNRLNKSVVTMNLSIDFIKAIPISTRIIAKPEVLHNGRQTMLCECKIVDENGKIYSKVHATFFVIGEFV